MTGEDTPTISMACLDEEAILAFAQGELRGPAMAMAEVHLDRCELCQLMFAEAVRAPDRLAQPAQLLVPPSFSRGDLLASRYRIVRFIARGGMGEVYEAEDTILGGRVALKSLLAMISDDPKAVARLKAEVQLARMVTHRNVCRVFDVDGSGGDLFLTMELLAGETLGARLRRTGRLPPEEVALLLEQMAAGLSEAHQAGVIHRDFKSDNVMVCPAAAPGEARVVITDFGLARATLVGPGVPHVSTTSGAIVGSLAYLAPEQVSGKHPISPASDVYALGVVLFELLTGVLPFSGGTAIETAVRRLTSDPPGPRLIVPTLPPFWDRVVTRCLAREPSDRWMNVLDVPEAIRKGKHVGAGRRVWRALAETATALLGRPGEPSSRS